MSFYKEVPGRKTTLESTLKFDTVPTEGSTNPVTSEGVKSAIDGAVGDASEALQQQIDEIAEKAGSGYIPKGEATVATLNGLSGQENGDLYTMTDAGTLTDGSLAVVAGDTVAWDATNEVWYKAMDYAPRQYGTNEVHNLPTTITAFRTGDYIAVDGTDTAKMSKDSLKNDIVEDANRAIAYIQIPKNSNKITFKSHNYVVPDFFGNLVVDITSSVSGYFTFTTYLGKVGTLKTKNIRICATAQNFSNFALSKLYNTASDIYSIDPKTNFTYNGTYYELTKNGASVFAGASDDADVWAFYSYYNPSASTQTKFFTYMLDDCEMSFDCSFGKVDLDKKTIELLVNTGILDTKFLGKNLYVDSGISVSVDENYNQVASVTSTFSGYKVWSVKLGTVADVKTKDVYVYTDNLNFSVFALSKQKDTASNTYSVDLKTAFEDIGGGKYRLIKPMSVFAGSSDSSPVYALFSIKDKTAGDPLGKFFIALNDANFGFDSYVALSSQELPADDVKKAANKLYNKGFWTLGDSLCHNTWQSYLVSATGCVWDATKNTKPDKPISQGGTQSAPQDDAGTQARAINLVTYKGIDDIDYVLIENVNDRNVSSLSFGTISDKPFMRSICKQVVVPDIEPSISNWISANWATIVAGVPSADKKKGYIFKFVKDQTGTARGSNITFSGSVTTEGDIFITLSGVTYGVHVTTGMSMSDVVDACLQYNYGSGWTDVRTGTDSFKIFYYTDTAMRATVNTGSTGLSASVADATGSTQYCLFYEEDTSAGFDTFSNWSHTDRTLYATYKGLVEYLKAELPKAKLMWFIPWAFGVNFSSTTYKNDDGSWSQDKFTAGATYTNAQAINDIQRAVAEYYGIQVIDMFSDGQLCIQNVETYFPTSNVHPNTTGYKWYAEYIAGKV